MFKFFYFFTTSLLTLCVNAGTWSEELKSRIDKLVQQNFQNQSQVGLVVGIIKNGEIHVWSYGERVLGSGEFPTGDTFFEMGSITKTYVGTLLALEVLRGKVQLNDPLKIFWKELEGTDAGEVTLEHLATHHSGLPRIPDNLAPKDPLNPYQDYSEERLLRFLKRFKFKKPGPFTYDYSNLGLGLLGYILADKLNHESFEHYFQKNLLDPLGIKETKTMLKANDLSRAAQGYGTFLAPQPFWDLGVLGPAGVLKTTVNDLLKYARFNMVKDGSELSRAADFAHEGRAETDQPGVQIGLAWHSNKLGSYTVINHGGATGGYRAKLIIDKEKQVAAMFLSNTNIAPECVLAPVFETDCSMEKWVVVETEKQKKLLGIFRAEAIKMNAEIMIENGILGLHPQGQSKQRLWPKSELEYSIPDLKATLVFKLSDEGIINNFILNQNGKSYDFSRK